MSSKITTHTELDVYRSSFEIGMKVFELSKRFPTDESYSLTNQIRRSSRSVSANIAEAWRKRRYEKSFVSKLSDAEAEAAESQVWVEYAVACGYLEVTEARELYRAYDQVLRTLVRMINNSEKWVLPGK